jgi:hypothetical protein
MCLTGSCWTLLYFRFQAQTDSEQVTRTYGMVGGTADFGILHLGKHLMSSKSWPRLSWLGEEASSPHGVPKSADGVTTLKPLGLGRTLLSGLGMHSEDHDEVQGDETRCPLFTVWSIVVGFESAISQRMNTIVL